MRAIPFGNAYARSGRIPGSKGSIVNVHAVFAVDPGGTTGVYAGWVELKKTRKETLTDGLLRSRAEEVTGDFLEQARMLYAMFVKFNFVANESNIPIPQRHVAVEDFVLRRRVEGGATGNLTSCWVAAAFAYSLQGIHDFSGKIDWQQPSSAIRLMTDARLRDVGLWIVGSTHKRDAARHFGLKVDKLVG